jgi:hypothetical protein
MPASRPTRSRWSPWRRRLTRRRRSALGVLLAGALLGTCALEGFTPAFAQSGSRLCASAFVSIQPNFEPNVTYVRLVEVAKSTSWSTATQGYQLCNDVRFDSDTYPGWTKSASYHDEKCGDFSANVLVWNTLDVASQRAYNYDGRDVCLSMQRSAIWVAKVVTSPSTGARRLVSWSQDWPPPRPSATQ